MWDGAFNTDGTTRSSNTNGVISQLKQSRMAEISDGTSNTILGGEFLSGSNASATGGPGKYPFDIFYAGDGLFAAIVNKSNPTLAELDAIGSAAKNSPQGVVTANGSLPLWYAASQSSFNTAAPPNWKWPSAGGNCCPGGAHDWGNGIIPPRSLHSGGVNFVMADGSVKFIRDSVDLLTFQNLGSVSDGQALSNY